MGAPGEATSQMKDTYSATFKGIEVAGGNLLAIQ
jgi:hypothetical protein